MIDLAVVFATGFLGSAHCVGMCGPLVASCARAGGLQGSLARQATFHSGRLTGYAALGALAGIIGSFFRMEGPWALLSVIAGILAGFVMVGLALEQLNILPKLGLRPPSLPIAKLLANPRPWASFPVGLALGLMPCGMLYAVVAYAAATGSPLKGALVMALFWLGNLLPLVAFGLASQFAWGRLRGHAAKFAAIAILILGVHTIVDRGMALVPAANAQQDHSSCHPSEVLHEPGHKH
ncbi:Cytochrome C biogenesis protein transmembrane region [compost metagenome]